MRAKLGALGALDGGFEDILKNDGGSDSVVEVGE